MEFLTNLFGGAFGAAIVAGLFGLIQWRLNRKAQKEDKAADTKIASCAARGQEIADLHKKVDSVIVAVMISYKDRIKHIDKSYIRRGYVFVEEYEDLKQMHYVYHTELGGNGFLDDLMNEVNQLEKRVK